MMNITDGYCALVVILECSPTFRFV